MARRAKNMLAKGCGCFEAGHLVWTTRGPIPIESVQIDDFVIAHDETTGETTLRRVIDTFMRRGAPIVAITITSAAGAGETFRTTEEHPFHVPNAGWVPADHLTPGDRVTSLDGQNATVAWISYTGERATVFNLEVEGLHDYYVGASGLLVHNTDDSCLTWVGRLSKIKGLARGNNARKFLVDSDKELKNLFDELSKGTKKMKVGDRTFANLPDGTLIQMRGSSRSGGAALDFTAPDGRIYTVHIR